jgi:hypothetical protein
MTRWVWQPICDQDIGVHLCPISGNFIYESVVGWRPGLMEVEEIIG